MFSNKKVFYIILLLIISNNLFAQPNDEIKIRILQKDTHIPVQFANISWQNIENTNLKGYTISNSKGYFQVSNIKNKKVILSISCVGYKSYCDTVQLTQLNQIYLEEDIFNLEQVTVTGTRTPYTVKKSPVLTQIVTDKEIKNVDATTVLEALDAEIPGIEIARHGYGPALNMQGLDANYTLILIDGERIAGETDGNIDYSKINTANIERVEIVRGASSTLYGSNAMGGVINIITKKPKNKIDFKADLRYGQTNQKSYSNFDLNQEDNGDFRLYMKNHDLPNLNGNLNLGIKNKSLYSNTYINFKSADAYQLYDSKKISKYYPKYDTTITESENIGTATANINGYMDYTISQKIGYENNKWTHEIKGNYYNHEEYDFDNNGRHNLYRNYTLTEKSKYSINKNQTFNLSLNHDVYYKYDVLDKTNENNKNYEQTFNSAKLNFTQKFGGKHDLFFGLENFNENLESDMFDSTETLTSKNANDFVLLLQDEYKLSKKIMFVFGARNSWHSSYNYHLTPSFTAKYSLKDINFRLAYARGFRSPSLKELYMNWDHLGMFKIMGNSNLKPEQNNYYSFSTDYINTKYKVNLTFITSYNQIYNKIEGYWSGSNQDIYYYSNIGKQSIFNIESIFKWKIYKGFKLKAGYVYTDVIHETKSVNLSAISPHAFNSQLEYNYRNKRYSLTLNISGKIIGKKEYYVQAGNDDLYPGEYYQVEYPTYSIWNLTINQQFDKYSLNFGIKNILDYLAPIANYNTSASPGRKYFLTIGIKL